MDARPEPRRLTPGDGDAEPSTKLVWLVTSFAGDAAHTGGVAVHLETLARGLESLGYRVRVITRRSLPRPAFWLVSGLVLLNRLATPLGSYLRARLAAWLMRRHLAALWAEEPPAAVVFEDLHGASPWPVPTLTFVHALDAEAEAAAPRWRPLLPKAWTMPLQRAYLRWELAQARRMPAWATVSDGFRNHLVSWYPEAFPPERGAVIYPGLDVDDLPPEGAVSTAVSAGAAAPRAASGPFVLASMGLLVPVKNQRFLLEVLARLPERCRLLLLGDGPERGNLENLARDLGVDGRVQFAGFVSGPRKYELLRSADCFLLPSLQETFGLALLEARLCGLPAIVSPVEVPEAFYDLKLDLDPETWAGAVRAWVENPQTLDALAAAARNKVEGRFTAAAMARRVALLLEREKTAVDGGQVGTG